MDLKDKIIHESLKLFSLKGFLSTSLNDILEASNSSKGGFYNHFKSKEALFSAVLLEARRIWRERVLFEIDDTDSPTAKIRIILSNYRDRYLKDSETFPGGCVFAALSVELDDQLPHLAVELNHGFVRLKAMIHRLLDQGKELGEIRNDVDTAAVAEMIFAGMIGSAVVYGMEKSSENIDNSLNSFIKILDLLA